MIPRSARPFRVTQIYIHIHIYINDRAEDLVIEKRVPVIFTVVGVENDSKFLINMFHISNIYSCVFVSQPTRYNID